jgi:hypothetical protein
VSPDALPLLAPAISAVVVGVVGLAVWVWRRGWRPGSRRVTRPGNAVADELWGGRLRRLHAARGMTRAALAEACVAPGRRTDRRDIVAYEEAGYYPRPPTFAALARVRGVRMEALRYGEEDADRLAWEREHADRADVRGG